MNGIDSLTFLSYFSLIMYCNAKEFCVLILYPANLLYLLVSSSNFLMISLGFSMYNIMAASSESLRLFKSGFLLFLFHL